MVSCPLPCVFLWQALSRYSNLQQNKPCQLPAPVIRPVTCGTTRLACLSELADQQSIRLRLDKSTLEQASMFWTAWSASGNYPMPAHA